MLTSLNWSLKLEIISYLNLFELYSFGCCNKFNFLLFLREKIKRKGNNYNSNLKKKFLGISWKKDCVSIASYPRCGNTFLRRLLEVWSGIITGADSHPCRTLSASLLKCGFEIYFSLNFQLCCYLILILFIYYNLLIG